MVYIEKKITYNDNQFTKEMDINLDHLTSGNEFSTPPKRKKNKIQSRPTKIEFI
jgi:hypothetical protein